METSELILPAVALGLIVIMLAMGLFNRVIAKLGLRNFYRHKGHAAISVAGLLVGREVQVRQFAHGMSHRIVQRPAFGDVSSFDVSGRNVHLRPRDDGGETLEAVSINHQEIRLNFRQGQTHGNDPGTDSLRSSIQGVFCQVDLDFRRYFKTIIFYLLNRLSEVLFQVCT